MSENNKNRINIVAVYKKDNRNCKQFSRQSVYKFDNIQID